MDLILGTVAPFVFEHSIGPIKRHVTYPFNYKSNIRSLEEGLEKLKSVRDRLQHSAHDHERNGKVIYQDVRDWLKYVDGIIEKVEAELVVANETTKKKCCLGFCPNLKTRYQVSKKAEQKAGDVVKLSQKRETFSTLFHTVALQWNGAFSIKDFEALESRLSVLKEIMNALTRFGVNTVGVHGVGGVGKTTLAREVGRKAKEEKLFDEVVMATVTAEVNVKNIQAQIADVLGLKFDVESEGGRASRLCERLKKEKKVLIILDDLWEKLDLKAVGIPSQDEHDGCKLLLTSRDSELLSNAMDSQENFPIDALAENEAWELFKKTANNSFQDLDLQPIAKEVANVCAGLPIAIVTVASSLKSKSLAQWRNALKELHTISSQGLTKIQATMYSPIEFSYKKLENEELQSTFLLCSQMGYDATIEDLLKYGIGLDLFHVSTLEEAQDRVYSLVQRLKTFCLLLEGNSKKQLLMHDVVRDVGRWIASRDQDVIVLNDKNNPKGWADEDKLKTYTRIWLCSNAEELLEEMQCPKLVFIHIDGNNGDLKIPDNLFKGLDKLRVLSLTSFYFSSFPPSLGLLENLKTLCFYQSFELGDIRIVGELKKLEVLSFAKSNIRELPTKIGELTKLKLLDLSDCGQLEVIPSNVLSKLCRLEELYMGGSFDRWETEGGDGASLIELKRLEFLTNLEIRIRDPYSIPEGIFSEKLRRYRLLIGEGISTWESENETLKRLKLKLDAKVNVLEGVLQLLKGTEDLYLYGVRNLLCELDSEGFPRLRHLCLGDSPGVQYIVEVTESAPYVAFPMLESLILENLVSLEKICQYRPKMQTFNNLRLVQVEGCSKLTYLFSSLVAQGLSQLREIEVISCESMEEIVGEGSIVAHTSKGEATKMITFSQLHVLTLWSLPKLRCFCSNAKQQRLSKRKSSKLLEANLKEDMEIPIVPLFNDQILFPNLEELKLVSINNETLTNTRIEDSFQKLVVLIVGQCDNLKYLFSPSLVKCLPQLKSLELSNCKAMEEVIGAEDDQQCMNNEVILFPKLQSLHLCYLPRLERFCKNQEVRLNEMSQNATQTQRPAFFGEMVVFPSLAELHIERMSRVQMIWHNEVAAPSFCELRKLTILVCNKLTKVFPSILAGRFQKLEVLSVSYSKWVENIFEVEESKDGVIYFELKELRLSGLPKLKQIWSRDPEGLVTFPNLQSVIVEKCEALKNVFPFSIATNLSLLNKIDLEGCGVEEIVANAKTNGEAAAATAPAPCFRLPELTTLKLHRVSELTSWYPGMHTLLLPKLKVLYMDRLNFNGKVEFNSEELRLDGKLGKDSKIWRDHFLANLFPTLKLHVQNLDDDNWDGIPSGFLQEFHNLEELLVKNSALEYLFSSDGSDAAAAVDTQRLPRLKHLQAEGLSDLRHMIYEQSNHVSHLSLLFRSLETLEVKWCRSLVSVAPSSTTVTFQNLTSLILCRCPKLLNTTLTAKSLTNLVKLEVRYCEMVTEIVQGKEGELDTEEEDEVVAKLQSLKLKDLKSLTCFCSGNYRFRFPYLNEVMVETCPRMKVFSPGLLHTPKLRDVYFNRIEKCWEGNLNDTIRKLPNQLVGFEGTWELKLSEFPDLQQIWHGPLPVKSFIQLWELEVYECSSFSTAVPFNLMPYLVKLYRLSVSKCDSVEGVFDLERLLLNADDVPNHHDGIQLLLPKLEILVLRDLPRLNNIFPSQYHRRGVLEFRNLSELELHNCSSLKNIFTPSMALFLVKLHRIEIRNCIALEEIITKENAGEAVSKVQDPIFPKLRQIVLESLPNLINFNSGDGIVKFSYLNEITVENCPNMKPFISSFLRGQVPRAVDETKEQRLDNHEIQPEATTSLIDDGDDKVAYPKLTKLRMDWNDTMEEIGHGQVKAEFLCQLQILKIINLPDDHHTFPSHFLLRFPNVRALTLHNALFKEIILHERTNGEDTGTGALPKLRKLTLSKLPNLMHLAKESSLCSTFQNLENLSVLDCGMLETLILHERSNGEDTGTGALPKLRELTLSKLPNLMHLAKESSSLCSTFQNLENLSVLECGMLETFVPSAISFHSLTTLEVSKCHKLLHFMTSTTATSLELLTRMSITECKMLEQIVQDVENLAENIGVSFTKLKCLELHCLPSLTGFSLLNCAFTFPSLNDFVVRECPKMKIFSQGVVTAPKLRRVRLTEGKEKWCWEGSLNATIQKLSMEMNADQTVMQSNQPNSSESSGIDVEAGEPGKNGTSEVLQEIKSPSVTKDLSLDIIITEHIEAEVTKVASTYQHSKASLNNQDRSLSTSMDIGSFSQAQMDACATVENEPSQDKTTPPSSTDQNVTVPAPTAAVEVADTPYSEPEENRILNVCERPASDSCKDNSSEPVVKGFLQEPKMVKIASTNQNPHAISGHDQEDPTLNQNSSTAMEMEKYIDSQVQMGLQEAFKKSDRIPIPSAAPEPAIVSTSESTKKKLSNQELTSSIVFKPSWSPPSFPITASSEKLVNISPASSLLASSSNTPPESCNSVLETNEYSISMSMLKNMLSKPLTEVVSSTDRVLLLSALKNLKKCECHLLNAQQIEAIQGFIDNFDSLVTYHPFYENQIEHIGAFKLSVEDKKKGIVMLKNHCEDLARKSASLDADMEALLKRLREMEEEKDKIREDMEDVRGKIAIDDGKLEEADTFILPEFEREQKEVEAKVSNSNSQWAKMRSLFP